MRMPWWGRDWEYSRCIPVDEFDPSNQPLWDMQRHFVLRRKRSLRMQDELGRTALDIAFQIFLRNPRFQQDLLSALKRVTAENTLATEYAHYTQKLPK